MKRRLFLTSTLAIPFLPRAIATQRAARVAHIGWLTAQQASSLTPFLNALRVGFADYGYEEGRNLVIEYRYGDDAIERVPELREGARIDDPTGGASAGGRSDPMTARDLAQRRRILFTMLCSWLSGWPGVGRIAVHRFSEGWPSVSASSKVLCGARRAAAL